MSWRCSVYMTFANLMKRLFLLLTVALMVAACGEPLVQKKHFKTEVLLKMTPVKNAKAEGLGWIYGMLATIETERLMLGDSVNLSPVYLARLYMMDQVERRYQTHGAQEITVQGTGMAALHLLERKGVIAFDSYRVSQSLNWSLLIRQLTMMTDVSWAHRRKWEELRNEVGDLLDRKMSPAPRFVFMYGCEYTPLQFAQSVCKKDDFLPLTSFTHHPFGSPFALETPGNYAQEYYQNVPIDTLISTMEHTLRAGHAVYWEGNAVDGEYSFKEGIARIEEASEPVTQEKRQAAFERFRGEKLHGLSMIGLAVDGEGQKYFICKDSRGIKNPYRGLVYMSFDYARMHTFSVLVPKNV